eukprot:gene1679-2023_t
MAWGKSAGAGIDDLAGKLRCNDERLRSLTILRFRRLNDQDVILLSEALKQNSVLQELTCSSHPISQAAAARLGAALQQNSTLQRISIGDSTLGDQALASMIDAGLHANKSLVTWDLEHKGLTQAAAPSLTRVLTQHPGLQHLNLSRNTISDQGLQQLCSTAWAPGLSRLELAQCGIGSQGLAALAKAPSLAQLQQLDLSQNQLGRIAAVGEALAQALCLRKLDVSNTGITSAGISGLAAALASNNGDTADAASAPGAQLKELKFADNPGIGDAAVAELARSLARPGVAEARGAIAQSGLSLDLAMSAVGVEGIQSLALVSHLEQLSLFGCKLGRPGISELIKCSGNGGFAALLELNLTGCSLQLEELQNLLQFIAGNSSVLPLLYTLELAANEGVQEPGFEELVAQLRAARPGIDVHFRMADASEQQLTS